jgi:hypothetical protein
MRQTLAFALTGLLFLSLSSRADAAPLMCGETDIRCLCPELGGQAQGFASHGLYCVIAGQSADSVNSLSYRMEAASDCAMFDKKMASKLGELVKSKGALGSGKCQAAKPATNYGEGPVVACYIKDRRNMPGWTMLWKDSVARSKGCDNVKQACLDMTKKWGGSDVCCTLQGGDVAVSGKQGDSFACARAAAPAPAAGPDLKGWFRLKTQFQGDGKCFEGNAATSTTKDGAAFMDNCQNVSGQLWQFVAEGEHYRLKTQFQGEKKCLEGNAATSTYKNGAAFMDDCKNVSGQLWKLVPEGKGYRLKTAFQGDGKCLESNAATSTTKDGAAFMDNCQNVSGQIWLLVR